MANRTNYGTAGPTATESGPEKGNETESPAPERGALPPTGSVAFYVDGRRVAVTQHKVSYMAGYTRTADLPRVPVKDLTAAIVAATGVAEADLYRTEWSFVLPQSGRTIETRGIPGRDPFPAEGEAKKPVAKPRRSRAKSAA